MTLALLLTAVTGAWATDAYEEFTTADENTTQLEFTGEHIKITGTLIDQDGLMIVSNYPVTISALNGKVITKIELTVSLLNTWKSTYAITSTPNATIEGTYAVGQKFTITPTGANPSEITLSANVDGYTADLQVKNWKVYYAEPTEWSLTPDETGKSWTLAKMPASNVELQVEYYAESNLFLSEEALADQGSIAVKAGDLGVQFGEDGKSTTTVTEGNTVTATYTGTKKVLGVKVEKKANNPYANAKLGDLFYSDGTFSTELEAGKTPIGVIAYLDQEGTDDDEITEKSNGAGHGLVLCLKDAASGADAQWSTEKSAFDFGEDAKVADVDALKRTTNVSGYTNTKTLAEKTDAATKYKAAYAAKNYTGLTTPTGTTGWFLPSAQQWMKMQTGLGALEESVFTWNSWFDKSHTAADKWEAALSKAGSGNYDSMTSAYLFCWSSSEYSVSSAVGLYVGAHGTGNNYGFRWLFRTKDDESNGNRVRPVLAF